MTRMPYLRFAVLAVPAFIAGSVHAATVVVIQGNNSSFGRRYFCGFTSAAAERISAFQYEAKKEDALVARVKKLAPDLIFTLGEVPLPKLVQLLPSTPFLIAGYHSAPLAGKPNVVTLESDLPIGAGLQLAQSLFPTRKTVGSVYNPRQSGDTFDTLVAVTGPMGLRLASLKVDTPADVKSFINAFAGKIDLLYWIRDPTTADAASLEEIFRFTEQARVPVISGDPAHLEKGALLAITVDPFAMGEEAWKIAARILKEGKIAAVSSKAASRMVASISLGAATRFGVDTEGLQRFLQGAIKDGYTVKVAP